jgi:hypothetical protein
MEPSDDAQAHVDEIEQLRSTPLRVSQIVFPPDLHTKSEKVLREFQPTEGASTLEEVLKTTDETLVHLEDLGVFKEINTEIAPARSVRFPPYASAMACRAHSGPP